MNAHRILEMNKNCPRINTNCFSHREHRGHREQKISHEDTRRDTKEKNEGWKGRRMEGRKKSPNHDLQDYGITRISNFPALAFFLPEGRHFSYLLIFSNSQLPSFSRPHQETNENQHKRIAQHIGPPRRGAPGRRRQEKC